MKKYQQLVQSLLIGLLLLSPMFLDGQILNQRADSAYAAFNKTFIFYANDGLTYYKTALNNTNSDYFWQQALDIQSAQDNYLRTGISKDRILIYNLLIAFNTQNSENWLWNEYNDDIFWADLAFLRGYESTGIKSFLDQGIYGFDLAYFHKNNGGNWGWDTTFDGGLWWSKSKGAKETLSNGPGVVAACYLYKFTGNVNYLNKAKEIYEWLRSHLRDETTGEIWSKINADGTIDKSVAIFNQGSFVGAANFLYQLTGEGRYFTDAKKTADRVITNKSNNGILASGQRGGTEMAEYFRWLGEFVRQNYLWDEYYSFLKMNADAAWSVRRRDLNITWNDFTKQMPQDNITGVNECNSAVVIQEMTPALQSIPDTIEAEDYNYMKGIRVEAITSGGKCVYSVAAGAWIEYIVKIPTTGVYTFNYKVASTTGASVFMQQNGLPLDTINFPVTADYQTYTTVSSTLKLTAGIHSIKIVSNTGGWKIDKWSAELLNQSIPGRIQAENYVAMNGIQKQQTSDVDGGENVSSIDAYDWMDYTISIPKTGNYAINYRVAGTRLGTISILQNGKTLSTTNIPSTGSWQNWVTVGGTSVYLSEGTQTIRVYAKVSGCNLNWWSADLDSIPTIKLTTPLADTTCVAPANIVINAAALDADGSVSKVDFYQGATLIGTDYSSPYCLTWPNVKKGIYTLSAKVTDNLGNKSTAIGVKVTVTNVSPTVSITSPANDTIIYKATTSLILKANAADNDGAIYKVEFYNGITLLGTDYTAPYSFQWANIVPRIYSVTAKAIDNGGAVTSSAKVMLSVVNPTGVEEIKASNALTIYPNPVSTSLTINCFESSFHNVVIYDSTGKIVLQQSGNYQGSTTINVEKLPRGIYSVLILTNKNGRLAKKFAK